jgi:hypothetical protein
VYKVEIEFPRDPGEFIAWRFWKVLDDTKDGYLAILFDTVTLQLAYPKLKTRNDGVAGEDHILE